jgi:4'-phosphopantetheinyl transferase
MGSQLAGLLDESERERAARIVREPVRRRWRAGRGVLRILLGAYTGEHPSAVRFAQEPRGKPILDLPGARALRFNMSHSGALAVYALTEMCDVGVDVELVARECSARAYSRDFLRAWVKREAMGKRIGVGAGNTTEPAESHRTEPWIAELDLGSGAVGAVALNLAPVDFRVYALDFLAAGSILPSGRSATLDGKSHVPSNRRAGDLPPMRKRSMTLS